jgi:hypothetical protein
VIAKQRQYDRGWPLSWSQCKASHSDPLSTFDRRREQQRVSDECILTENLETAN